MTGLAILMTVMGGCFLGSIVPFINTEIIVLGAAAAAPPSLALPLILIASISQMTGKAFLYYAGTGIINLPKGRFADSINAGVSKVREQKRASGATLFASASLGLPPFYVLSIASGALGVDFRQFILIGFAGRTLRFGALVLIPLLIKALF